MSEKKAFKDLILSDNYMFGEVMSDKNICRMFLSELLKKELVEIEFASKEKVLDRIYNSQGVRLDIIAKDSSGIIYDIEMQKTDKRDIERRSRYYVGNIDKEYFPRGHKNYNDLKDCYIIFICTYDHVGEGYAFYERYCCYNKDWNMPCDNGAHLLILNAGYDRKKNNIELPIEEFLGIIKGVESNYSSALARDVAGRITDIRNDHEKELEYMTVEEWLQDEKDEARAEGRAEGFSAGRESGLSDGLEQGRAEGFSSGRESGLSDGIEQGRAEERAEVLKNLGMSEEDYQKILQSASK